MELGWRVDGFGLLRRDNFTRVGRSLIGKHWFANLAADIPQLCASAGYGRNDENFIAILKCILLVAQETDVFFVNVEIDKASNLAVLVAQMRAEVREGGFDFRNKLGQIARSRLHFARAVCMFLKCVG
jgi:hypothetical protein